ncbi:MAG: ferredoxin [Gammaproteobacteria bacterium]|jgi:ferredoxin
MIEQVSYQVTLLSDSQDQVSFPCPPKISILRAAKNAGFELSAGCMQGRCYTCRSQLVAGRVTNSRALSRNATVDPSDLGENRILLCSVSPTDDVIVKPEGPWERSPTRL